MYQLKRFFDMEQSPLSMFLLLSTWFVSLGLCSVSYTANEYSLYLSLLYYDKRGYISLSRVIIIQDFETVTFYVLYVYKPTFSVILC